MKKNLDKKAQKDTFSVTITKLFQSEICFNNIMYTCRDLCE